MISRLEGDYREGISKDKAARRGAATKGIETISQETTVQMCWLVDYMEAAATHWVKTAGAGPFPDSTYSDLDELRCRGTYDTRPALRRRPTGHDPGRALRAAW